MFTQSNKFIIDEAIIKYSFDTKNVAASESALEKFQNFLINGLQLRLVNF
jgi:hypothetical protein